MDNEKIVRQAIRNIDTITKLERASHVRLVKQLVASKQKLEEQQVHFVRIIKDYGDAIYSLITRVNNCAKENGMTSQCIFSEQCPGAVTKSMCIRCYVKRTEPNSS